jgi:PAS domain S-box-containing protein
VTVETNSNAARAADGIQTTLLGEVIDTADVAVFVFDEDENYVAVNRRACELTGYTREEILEMRVREISPRPARTLKHLEEVSRGRRNRGTAKLLRKDGTVIEVAYRASHATIAGMPFLVGFCWPARPEPA